MTINPTESTRRKRQAYREEILERFKIEITMIRIHWKAIVRILFALLYLASMLFRNLAYYRAVQGETLKDLGFEVIPEMNSSFKALSEIVIYLNHLVAIITLLILPIFGKHSHESGVSAIAMLLRLANVLAVGHLLRFFSYITTSLPGPAEHCRVGSADFDRPTTWSEILFRFSSAADLNCGDLIFSGHQFQDIVFAAAIWHYGSRVFEKQSHAWIAKLIMLATVIAQFFLIVASRNHYTVDVVVSSYTAPLLWISFDKFYNDAALPLPIRAQTTEGDIENGDHDHDTANESSDNEEPSECSSQCG